MRNVSLIFLISLFAFAESPKSLTVYTYDSFAGKHSLGEALSERFEKKTKIKTDWVVFSSEGEALNQIVIEKEKTRADILIGVDTSLLARAKASGAFRKTEIFTDFSFDSDHQFIPFDYGYLSLVYDSSYWKKALPKSFDDLCFNPSFRNSVILEDPRTSSIGLGFLSWTHLVFAENRIKDFWSKMALQVFSVSPGWSGAYGLFLKNAAPFVVSYTTSPAYHIEKENRLTIKAMLFPEGHFRQVEGAAIVKYSKNIRLAEQWISFLLSEEIQSLVPTHQWMYPVRKDVPLPVSFQKLPQVSKGLESDPSLIEKSKKKWLREWTSILSQKKP